MKTMMPSIKCLKAGILLIAGAVLFETPVWAEAMAGHVINVNIKNQAVTIQKTEALEAGEPGQSITIQMKDETRMEGFAALDELAVGDEVRLEANRKYFYLLGPWQAEDITRQVSEPVSEEDP